MSVYSTLIDLWNSVTTSNGSDSIRVNVIAGGGGGGGVIGLFTLPYDAITATYPSATQDVYQTHTGGTGGPVVQTLTVNYTDATRTDITDASVV